MAWRLKVIRLLHTVRCTPLTHMGPSRLFFGQVIAIIDDRLNALQSSVPTMSAGIGLDEPRSINSAAESSQSEQHPSTALDCSECPDSPKAEVEQSVEAQTATTTAKATTAAAPAESEAPTALDFSKYSPTQLKQYMSKLFQIGDADGNGSLDREEVKALLGWSGFQFKLRTVDEVLEQCDKNGDGVIDYDEFVSLMTKFCCVVDDGQQEQEGDQAVDAPSCETCGAVTAIASQPSQAETKPTLKKGSEARYLPTGEVVLILDVHLDDPPFTYYTIQMPSKNEKQTTGEKLEALSPRERPQLSSSKAAGDGKATAVAGWRKLKSNWSAIVDKKSGKTYYFNEVTKKTVWKAPHEYTAALAKSRSPQRSPSPTPDSSGGGTPTVISAASGAASSGPHAGWTAIVDKKSGKTYYFNEATQQTVWKQPAEFRTAAAAAAKQ